MTLFERVKIISKKHGFSSLQTLSEQAGLSPNVVYGWKTKEPSTKSLQAVADVLGVSVDYLLGNTDDMHANKKADTSSDDLKEYFDEHPVLKFDGKEIPDAEMKIIKRILEDMDD
ncbi:helix-turn-helix domain-containing protein [Weissella paramesenteroides]|uniref:helix-turn-helix domain-containing protein n=1 Tax=Weissella paramesenteroides TaxID=1249 RepID=UPI00123C6114|nr:helix-turn-helix transcriptional regulator [Weissella paramesenteroides]KAA8446971.1 helix-turn-helix transcriptional regulator [Weissella paramesenteroides]KAA8450607.1 helix-turn-helix transcriptional regulator [Weissella paramesenteroides]